MYSAQLCQQLSVRLHALSRERRWPEALAQCWHSLVFKSGNSYHQAGAIVNRFTIQKEASELVNPDSGLSIWSPAEFEESISKRPLVVLRALALLAAALPNLASGQIPIQLPPSVYSGGVIECEVCQWSNESEIERSTVFTVEMPPARTDSQSTSLHAYTAPFHLLPDKLGELNIKVSTSGSILLDERLRSIRESGRSLRIYVAEFLPGPHFQDDPKQQPNSAWIAKGLENEPSLESLAIAHLNSAENSGCDVLIFPELTITPGILKSIQRKLLLQPKQSGSMHSNRGLALVICGSFHYPISDSEAYCNVTYALDAAGNVIHGLTHTKLSTVSLGNEADQSLLNEAIHLGNTLSLVATPIGLLCSCICLDLAQRLPGYEIPLSHIPFSVLFVPSLSKKTNAHLRSAQDILLHQTATIIVANQAAATFRGQPTVGWKPDASFIITSIDSHTPIVLKPTAQFDIVDGAKIYEAALPMNSKI
jgi:hypothetical protein